MNTSTWGPSTIIAAILTVAVAIAGGVIAALHPTTLSFTTYAEILAGFAGANGLTAIGHGILNSTTTTTASTTTSTLPAPVPGATATPQAPVA